MTNMFMKLSCSIRYTNDTSISCTKTMYYTICIVHVSGLRKIVITNCMLLEAVTFYINSLKSSHH